jgi:hypothetical protein
MRKIVLSSICLLTLFLIAALVIVTNPQWYYFEDKLEHKNIVVYYDKPLPQETLVILNDVVQLIKKSDFYKPNLKFKVFMQSERDRYTLLPFQFPRLGFGESVQFISNNIYISHADIENNQAHSGLGTRTLSSVIAHEIVHILIEKKFGYFASRFGPFFRQDDFSPMKYLWKEEGYAEYIAGDIKPSFEDGLDFLRGKTTVQHNAHIIEYFKSYLAVKYLLEIKNYKAGEIFAQKILFDEVVSKAIEFYQQES